ncbi:MAG: DUF973 family protein [Thermoprotei archaeon]
MIESYSGSETLNFGDARYSVRSSPPPDPGPQTSPSSPGQPPFTQDDVTALNKLRKFALYNILTLVFIVVGVIGAAFMAGLAFGLGSAGDAATAALAVAAIVMVVFILLAIVLGILSIVNLRSAFKTLKNLSSEFETPYLGANLVVLSLVLTVIAVIAFVAYVAVNVASVPYQHAGGLPGSAFAVEFGAFGFIIAIAIIEIIGLVGWILALTVGGFRLKKRYGVSGFSTAGILYVIGFVLAVIAGLSSLYALEFVAIILSLIAIILYYTSSKEALGIVKSQLGIP